MKGGGFVVFLFLLVCFLWGVASVVGGIRRKLDSWSTPAPPEPAPPPSRAPPTDTARASAVQR